MSELLTPEYSSKLDLGARRVWLEGPAQLGRPRVLVPEGDAELVRAAFAAAAEGRLPGLPAGASEEAKLAIHQLQASVWMAEGGAGPRGAAVAAALSGELRLALCFAGQARGWIDDLARLHAGGGLPARLIEAGVAAAEDELAAGAGLAGAHPDGADALAWIAEPAARPAPEALAAGPLSQPFIFLTQAAALAALEAEGLPLSQIDRWCHRVIGHSQGILAALLAAEGLAGGALIDRVCALVRYLVWQGVEMQRSAAASGGAGPGAPMLAVNGLPEAALRRLIGALGLRLSAEGDAPHADLLTLALHNAPDRFVLSGAPAAIERLRLGLEAEDQRAAEALRRGQGPRRPSVRVEALAVSAPFHSPFMAGALAPLRAHAARLGLAPGPLKVPVLCTDTGAPWSGEDLVAAMCVAPVRWNAVCEGIFDATHALDLGPEDGVSALTAANLAGRGVAVVALGAPHQRGWLRDPDPACLRRPAPWADRAPRWAAGPDGQPRLVNAWTARTGTPPVFLPGMTPTTTESPLVAAVAKAGFLAELAGGGQPTEAILRARAEELKVALEGVFDESGAPAGYILNTLYLDPTLWKLQVGEARLVQKLRAEGHPIRGLTISAGIPPVEEAVALLAELGRLGMTTNSLKVGNPEQVAQALEIARAWAVEAQRLSLDPTLIIQIECGRAGGHHGLDDLETLLLQTYAKLRAAPEVLLAVGGGVDGPARVAELLSGAWSLPHGRAPMPVDAVFVGTLFMAAAEAATSPQVKAALVAAPGAPVLLSRGAVGGGVRSGRSGLGADIYLLDNHAGRVSALLDRLAGDEAAVAARRDELIAALAKTARPYIGPVAGEGSLALLQRLVARMAIGRGRLGEDGPFLDATHRRRLARFTLRLLSRALRAAALDGAPVDEDSVLQVIDGEVPPGAEAGAEDRIAAALSQPQALLERLAAAVPSLAHTPVLPEDERFFVEAICKAPGKPLPFVPVIDGDLHRWYNRDALWFSHDDRFDADAVLVIPGPSALRGLSAADRPAAELLGWLQADALQAAVEAGPALPAAPALDADEVLERAFAAPRLLSSPAAGDGGRESPLPALRAAAGDRLRASVAPGEGRGRELKIELAPQRGPLPSAPLRLRLGLQLGPGPDRLALLPGEDAALRALYAAVLPTAAPMGPAQRADLRRVVGDRGPAEPAAVAFAAALPALMAALLDPAVGADPLSLLHVRSEVVRLADDGVIEAILDAGGALEAEVCGRAFTDGPGGRAARLLARVWAVDAAGAATDFAALDQTFLLRRVSTPALPPAALLPAEGAALGAGIVALARPRPLFDEALRVPRSLDGFSAASGDTNPIHRDPALAALGGLPGPIAHGQWVAAALLGRLVEADGRLRWTEARFLAPVPLGAALRARARVVGRVDGDEIIELDALLDEQPALRLRARRAAPRTAVLFPGQGVQQAGMGMDAFARSPAARAVWERADAHSRAAHGFSLLQVVRENPRQLDVAGQVWRHPEGVLHLTQLTQVGLTVLSVAGVAELRERGALPPAPVFAGHSVGEYSALAAISEVLPLEALIDVVYHRGLTMQGFVPRDAEGRSDYQMGVVRPNRVGLDEAGALALVRAVSEQSGLPLYVVNHNIQHRQYAVAGHKGAVAALVAALDARGGQGQAWVELIGIDVPFHSPLLAAGVAAFRETVDRCIPRDLAMGPLLGRYIPNLVARPFSGDAAFVAAMVEAIGEPAAAHVGLHKLLPVGAPGRPPRAPVLDEQTRLRAILVELLAWQFASPVRWIETQERLIADVQQIIEVGPKAAPVLLNMMGATLGGRPGPALLHAERDHARVVGEGPAAAEVPTVAEAPPVAPSPAAVAQVAAPAAAPVALEAAPAVEDVPLAMIDVLVAVLAVRLGKELSAIDPSKSIDALLGGNSARRNQVLLDLGEELGGAAPDGAQERPLQALAASLHKGGAVGFGPVLRAAVAAGCAKLGLDEAALRRGLRERFGLPEGLAKSAELLVAAEAGAIAAGGKTGAAAVDAVVQRLGALRGRSFAPRSAAAAGGGAAVDSGALRAAVEAQAQAWRSIAEKALVAAGLDPMLLNAPAPAPQPLSPAPVLSFAPEQALTLEGGAAAARAAAWAWGAALVEAEGRGRALPEAPACLPLQQNDALRATLEALARRAEGMARPAAAEALRRAAAAPAPALPWAGEVALLTGAGPGAIAEAAAAELLRGGATVVLTCSRLDRRRRATYVKMFRENAALGAALHVVPFDQGAAAAPAALIDWLCASAVEVQGGQRHLLRGPLVPTMMWPFGAVGAEGDPTELGDTPEGAALRRSLEVNLLGVERLVGALAVAKKRIGGGLPPALVVLPLSPNHGQMGRDGLYAEAKAGLEALMARWAPEKARWGDQISLIGARIGWVRGTGLMAALDGVYHVVEAELGIQTRSAAEMAAALLAACGPAGRSAAAEAPVWLDLSGGFGAADGLRSLIDRALKGAQHAQVVNKPLGLPQLPMPGGRPLRMPAAGSAPALDLREIVVVVGMAEVGPFGEASARWSVEAGGALSPEAALELALRCGLVKFAGADFVDAETGAPVDLATLTQRYALDGRVGVRLSPPLPLDQRTRWSEVVLTEEQRFTVSDRAVADSFVALDPEHTEVWPAEGGFLVRRRPGARVRVPRLVEPDRDVSARLPEGMGLGLAGFSEDQLQQVDPVALMNMLATAEALRSAGLTGDPAAAVAEVAAPARVACTVGSGIGGMRALRRLYVDPALDRERQTDTLQETLINVTAAWPAMALTGAAGPMLHPVGACATAALSVEVGLSLLRTGAADLVFAGAFDDIGPEGMQGFADMGATLSAAERKRRGLEPSEASRPMDRRRAGFVEAQGGGSLLLCRADRAVALGLPIYGIIGGAWSAGDGLQRSVPAPGLGLLRIGAGGAASELGLALSKLGLAADDLAAVSLHGTSTEANDKNECELHQRLALAIGRDPHLPLPVVAQKALTGHSKGGAAAWQLIGLCQALRDGVVPGLSRLEDPSPHLAERAPLVLPTAAAPLSLGKAALLTSLGFGHVGAAVLVAHPDLVLGGLNDAQRAAYADRLAARERARAAEEGAVRLGLRPRVPAPGAPAERFVEALLSDPRSAPSHGEPSL